MRYLSKYGFSFNARDIANAIGANPAFDSECWSRLADLVDGPVLRGGMVFTPRGSDVMLCVKEVGE